MKRYIILPSNKVNWYTLQQSNQVVVVVVLFLIE